MATSSFLEVDRKTIIGMAHIGALPGAPMFDPKRGFQKLVDDVCIDVTKLQDGGVDGILFCNENDRPYVFEATPEGVAAMAALVAAVKPILKIPFGVDFLWDPRATVAIGSAVGASFVREIFTGVFASDMGMWEPDCAGAVQLRQQSGRTDMKLMFNVNAEFAHSLDARPVEVRAQSVVFSSLADVILVSGPMTGRPTDISVLEKVCSLLARVPVLANTGVTLESVSSILSVASGAIVGTHFKIGGITWNPIDGDRVKRFMDKVSTLR
jgi:membrane complex biogenesis BtpA family protein